MNMSGIGAILKQRAQLNERQGRAKSKRKRSLVTQVVRTSMLRDANVRARSALPRFPRRPYRQIGCSTKSRLRVKIV
jgi:hypothetical protein